MLRNIILSLCGFSVIGLAIAQDSSEGPQEIIYKWKTGRLTHYAKQPPHGILNITKLDKDGDVITDDKNDQAVYNALRPMRPSTAKPASPFPSSQKKSTSTTDNIENNKELPQGAISREQRCTDAQKNIAEIKAVGNKPLNVEDANGNLIPMTEEQKNQRLQQEQALVDRLCNK